MPNPSRGVGHCGTETDPELDRKLEAPKRIRKQPDTLEHFESTAGFRQLHIAPQRPSGQRATDTCRTVPEINPIPPTRVLILDECVAVDEKDAPFFVPSLGRLHGNTQENFILLSIDLLASRYRRSDLTSCP